MTSPVDVDGSPLVVVPGLGLDERSWRPTLQALSIPASAVVTLPGFGEPAGDVDVSPPVLAELLLSRLRRAGPVVLAGHSAGCQVVAHAARIAPHLVTGLVLVGPTTDPRAASWRRLGARWVATVVHETPRQVPLLVSQYKQTGLRNMCRAMASARVDRIDVTLAQVACPVLVVRGSHDHISPDPWAHELGTSTATVPGGAHMVPWSHGDETAAAIAQFPPLSGLGSTVAPPSGR